MKIGVIRLLCRLVWKACKLLSIWEEGGRAGGGRREESELVSLSFLPSFDDGLLDSPFVAGIPSFLDRMLIDRRDLVVLDEGK